MIRIRPLLTGLALAFVLAFGVVLRRSFRTVRPIFRARGKINAEVTGRLTEALSGVRVVKGYHAEEREEAVFARGVRRLLDNVLQSLTVIATMSLSATLFMGIVGAVVMSVGVREIFAGTLTLGGFVTFTAFLAFREQVVTRRTKFRLAKARKRGHETVGLAIAVANIDEVIRVIRNSADPAEARDALLSRSWPAGDMLCCSASLASPRSGRHGACCGRTIAAASIPACWPGPCRRSPSAWRRTWARRPPPACCGAPGSGWGRTHSSLEVTAFGRVVVDLARGTRLPRPAVQAVSRWYAAFAADALQLDPERAAEHVREATRYRASELEILGFYDKLA